MATRGSAVGGPKVKRVMTQAINLIFEFLKNVSYNVLNGEIICFSMLNFQFYIREKEFKFGFMRMCLLKWKALLL
jgi:hypothetical protein